MKTLLSEVDFDHYDILLLKMSSRLEMKVSLGEKMQYLKTVFPAFWHSNLSLTILSDTKATRVCACEHWHIRCFQCAEVPSFHLTNLHLNGMEKRNYIIGSFYISQCKRRSDLFQSHKNAFICLLWAHRFAIVHASVALFSHMLYTCRPWERRSGNRGGGGETGSSLIRVSVT